MPRVIRLPESVLPMSVAAAAQAFGSEVGIALIRHYRVTPCSQREASEALGLERWIVQKNTRRLLDIGVVVEEFAPRGPRGAVLCVDEARLAEILDDLRRYSLDDLPHYGDDVD